MPSLSLFAGGSHLFTAPINIDIHPKYRSTPTTTLCVTGGHLLCLLKNRCVMPRRRRQGEQSTSFWTHHVPIVFFYLLASPSVCPRISASNPTAFSPTPKSPGSWPSPLSSVSPNMFRDLSEDSLLARTMVGQQQREGGGDLHSLAAPGAEALRLSHGTTTVALVCQGGVVAAVDSRASMGSFVGSRTTQKVGYWRPML